MVASGGHMQRIPSLGEPWQVGKANAEIEEEFQAPVSGVEATISEVKILGANRLKFLL